MVERAGLEPATTVVSGQHSTIELSFIKLFGGRGGS